MSKPAVAHWVGRVLADQAAAHEQFVASLATPEAERGFRSTGVISYELAQRDDHLHVTFQTKSPPDTIKFLRLKRLWPDFWIWESSEAVDFGSDAIRFSWRRPDA